MLQQAERFAIRLRQEGHGTVSAAVRRGFVIAFGREPSAPELAASVRLASTHGSAQFCRALFNASEFVFVN